MQAPVRHARLLTHVHYIPASRRRLTKRRSVMAAQASGHKETYPPSDQILKRAHIKEDEYEKLYKESLESPETFWGRLAEEFHWHKRWEEPFTRCNPSALRKTAVLLY